MQRLIESTSGFATQIKREAEATFRPESARRKQQKILVENFNRLDGFFAMVARDLDGVALSLGLSPAHIAELKDRYHQSGLKISDRAIKIVKVYHAGISHFFSQLSQLPAFKDNRYAYLEVSPGLAVGDDGKLWSTEDYKGLFTLTFARLGVMAQESGLDLKTQGVRNFFSQHFDTLQLYYQVVDEVNSQFP